MKRLLLVCTIAALFSCKKSDNNPNPVNPSGDYMAFSQNSTWTYSTTTDGTAAPDYTLTMTNKDTTINGKSYKVVANSAGPNNYQGKVGADYYRFGKIEPIAPDGIEELYLKADAATGGTWGITLPPTDIPGIGTVNANGTYTIVARDITKTVLTNTFTNVIHVRLIGKASSPLFPGIQFTVLTGNFYYAKGIGMVSYTLETTIPNTPTSTTQVDVKSYSIK